MTRKTYDSWVIQCDYGQGWEDECVEFTRTEWKVNIKAYRENSPYPLRTVRKRVPKSSLSRIEIERIERAKLQERHRRHLASAKVDFDALVGKIVQEYIDKGIIK